MSQLFTTPPRLGTRQQFVYDLLTHIGPAKSHVVGVLLHRERGCKTCLQHADCEYAASSGHEVLESLRRLGLLKRDRHHVYRRADTPNSQGGDIPY